MHQATKRCRRKVNDPTVHETITTGTQQLEGSETPSKHGPALCGQVGTPVAGSELEAGDKTTGSATSPNKPEK